MAGDGNTTLKDLSIVRTEAAAAVVEWARVRFSEMPSFQRDARARIAGALTRQGIVRAGKAVTFSRPPSGDSIEVAPGVLLEDEFRPVDAISLQLIPAGRAAHGRLEAPYEELPQAWRLLMDWVSAQGLQPTGLHWEVYGDPSKPVTALYALLE